MPKKTPDILNVFLLATICIVGTIGCNRPVEDAPGTRGPSPPRTPEEALEAFQVDDGLEIQLVASEPMVQDPVVIAFDEDGRLWVVEMRGFMPDIDGNGADQPVGRVSVLEDEDGDGRMDKSTVFLDSLVMPRALAIVKGGALVVENMALWYAKDNDNDLIADSKKLIDPDYAGTPYPEHSGNGLWRGMDNWYYNAKSRYRYRLIGEEWVRDSTEFRGQWGISHDDKGRLFYNYNWSQLHADLVPPNSFNRNRNHPTTTGIDHGLTLDRRVYPIRPTPAVNRGYIPGTLDEEGKLLEFTSASAPLVYRGRALPEEYYGNAFVCEPSGNLVKRNVVAENGLMLTAHDPHPGREFLASTDERFRPVFLASGPDGALYVADMYRGLIQHGAYVTPYLREQTLKRDLVLPINYGRIWRVTTKNKTPEGPKKLSKMTSWDLTPYLSHPNGWYRDMAQRLLVERLDTTIVDELKDMALFGENWFGRAHALWTLEGLGIEDKMLLLSLTGDEDSFIAATALRLIGPLAAEDPELNRSLTARMVQLVPYLPAEVALQLALTARYLERPVSTDVLIGLISRFLDQPLMRDAVLSSLEGEEYLFLKELLQFPVWQDPSPDKEVFLEMLTAAIVKNRNTEELQGLLDYVAEGRETDWRQRTMLQGTLLHGSPLTERPVGLKVKPRLFDKKFDEETQVKLERLSSMFSWPGHSPDINDTTGVVLSSENQKLFVSGRQQYLAQCAGCHGLDGKGLNRFGPPLAGSEWVTEDTIRLILLVLHGLEGPLEVDGKMYDVPDILPVMPAHSTMDDREVSAVLTYIRNEWGNAAGVVSPRDVGKTRHTSQGRVVPWTVKELEEYLREKKEGGEY